MPLETLARMGWNPHFQQAFEARLSPDMNERGPCVGFAGSPSPFVLPHVVSGPSPATASDLTPARVVAAHRGRWLLSEGCRTWAATLAGRVDTPPAVGDWALARVAEDGSARIEGLLPRRTALRRRAAGSAPTDQVLAANLDRVLLVAGLDGDFNPRRLERGLALVQASGAEAMVILNKADLHPDPARILRELRLRLPSVEVLALSATTGEGLEALSLAPGETLVLLGSSGVGKSTLVNALLGEGTQRTLPVRDHDQRGRHTTTHRELFVLPSGALLIDTPGLRELQLWGDEDLGSTFADLTAFAPRCRFRNCRHESEPGCAVREAVDRGHLDEDRLSNFHQLRKEQAFRASQEDPEARRERKAAEKRLHRHMRNYSKDR